jgi:lipopolysaccharide transport system ATP-binding protein
MNQKPATCNPHQPSEALVKGGLATPPSQDEVLVKVEGVSKKFCRDLKKSLWYGVCDIASELLPYGQGGKPESGNLKPEANDLAPNSQVSAFRSQPSEASLRPDEFFAVKDVSFELRRGECLGLIGRNGAGKTTLLKMLNGLIKPDSGRIEMKGRIGALIALGAGFNPILTGRENVYVNGTVLGLTKKEIDAKFDEIVDFAEIEEFIDAPVRSYSSGMQVRLGFAVASTLDPDVLIIDEVLAVGDQNFKSKCYQKIGKIIGKTAVIFVAHNMAQITRICSKVMLLERGCRLYSGATAEGVTKYIQINGSSKSESDKFEQLMPAVYDARLTFSRSIKRGEFLEFEYSIYSAENIKNSFIIINFFDEGDAIVAQSYGGLEKRSIELKVGRNCRRYKLGPIHLKPGSYKVSLIHKDSTGVQNLYWNHKGSHLEVEGNFDSEAYYVMPEIIEQAI